MGHISASIFGKSTVAPFVFFDATRTFHTMPSTKFFILAGATLNLGLLVACSGSDSSQFENGSADGNGSNASESSVFGGQSDNGNVSGQGVTEGSGNLAACTTSEAAATLAPVNLVFMFDESGSMGDRQRAFTCPTFEASCGPYGSKTICAKRGTSFFIGASSVSQNGNNCPLGTVAGAPAYLCSDVNATGCNQTSYFDPAKRWIPATNALKSFFGDPKSAGLAASLQFFPLQGGDGDNKCQAGDYQTPVVALTKLPNGTPFASAIDARAPRGSTPTDVALSGAYAHARSVKAAHPGEGIAVVLVTDGEPNSCESPATPSLELVKTTAQGAASDPTSPVRTYVIGIGEGLANLNQIAASGGTSQATIVSTTSPAQTATDFQNALDTIRGTALPCDVALPAPPNGKELDINAVNVNVTSSAGSDTLSYNKDCTGGTGWHYDNASAPTRVILCTSSCTTVRENASSRLSISFGCATKGGVIR